MAQPEVIGTKTVMVNGQAHTVTVYAPVQHVKRYRARLRSQATRKDMLDLLASLRKQLADMQVRA